MTAVLIVAHAPLATALRAVAQHAYPDCAGGLAAVDVGPESPPADVEADLRAALQAFNGQDVLILTDVFGATPCNVAMHVSDGVRARVVTGVNVPMVWRTLCYTKESLEALVVRALVGASQGIMQVATPRPQNQNSSTASHDQVQRSHQQ
jgi:PTS system ascorbate-specific IIA component